MGEYRKLCVSAVLVWGGGEEVSAFPSRTDGWGRVRSLALYEECEYADDNGEQCYTFDKGSDHNHVRADVAG